VEKREWAILDSEVMLTLVPRRERASVLMSAPASRAASSRARQNGRRESASGLTGVRIDRSESETTPGVRNAGRCFFSDSYLRRCSRELFQNFGS
jgi:hypothetical protein